MYWETQSMQMQTLFQLLLLLAWSLPLLGMRGLLSTTFTLSSFGGLYIKVKCELHCRCGRDACFFDPKQGGNTFSRQEVGVAQLLFKFKANDWLITVLYKLLISIINDFLRLCKMENLQVFYFHVATCVFLKYWTVAPRVCQIVHTQL